MKSALMFLFGMGLIVAANCAGSMSPADSYFKDRTVKLQGGNSMCSGEQITAPSGKTYILSAGHCAHLAVSGSIEVVTSGHKTIMRHVIAEDVYSDLLLIEGLPSLDGLAISSSDGKGGDVRLFTHGNNLETWEAEGSIIDEREFAVPVFSVDTAESQAACALPKYAILGGTCILDVRMAVTEAMIVPGSSGGMAVDNEGALVGVVSAGNGTFGALVRLSDIKRFLAGY